MKANGNASARAIYEKAVPAYYYRPQENDYVWVHSWILKFFPQASSCYHGEMFDCHKDKHWSWRTGATTGCKNSKFDAVGSKPIDPHVVSLQRILTSFFWAVLTKNIFFFCLHLNHSVLREQWIRAKYERMEFTGETKYPPISYTTGEDSLQVSL